MSQQSEQAEADAESRFTSDSVVEQFEEVYHLPVLGAVIAFMIWVRTQAYDAFASGDRVLFSGNDAYYHFRQVSYTVNNWPFTMPYDPWTRFPYGTNVGQFGTLYDQVVATAALVVGLGDPSTREVALTLAVAPAVIGALVALPVYFIGKRLHSRPAGLFGVLVLAILPGEFLRRSTVGFADHHVAETLMMTTGVLAVMVALGVSERELPVYEQLLDRDWEGLATPAKWAAIAGLAMAAYIAVWPPGVVLVGIVGIFFAIAIPVEYFRGRTPDHLAFVGAVAMGVLGVATLVLIETFSLSATQLSLVQPLLAFGVAAGCLVLAGLARVWDDRGFDRRGYPLAIAGLALAGTAFLALALPDLYQLLINQSQRAFGFGQSASTLTISEAQPTPGVDPFDADELSSYLYRAEYGLTYVVALVGVFWLLAHMYFGERYRSELLLVVVWTVFVTLMALTQVRFHYYLAAAVAVMNAWVLGRVIEIVGVPDLTDRVGDMKGYQVLTLLAVVMLVVAPLAPPLAAGTGAQSAQQGSPLWVVPAGDATGPSGTNWVESGQWMSGNTPEPGNYGGAGNADELDYYGSYGATEDFDYPEGSYGVMSWWDYGHWITVLGERIPHANPFQENARSASSFLQSGSERRANLILEALPSLRGQTGEIDEMSNEELAAVVDEQGPPESHEDVRYVMIDDETATTKFQAVTRWSTPPNGTEYGGYIQRGLYDDNQSLQVTSDQYGDTMVSRLYLGDANGLSHYRLVHETPRYTVIGGATNSRYTQSVPLFTFSTNPYNLVFSGWNSQLGNVSRAFRASEARGRTVDLGQLDPRLQGLRAYNANIESVLKTFEYVPGAQVTGQLNGTNVSGETVIVSLTLETGSGRTFQYVQRAEADSEGRFTMTVPYATDNSVGPEEGGTNASVQATGNYSVFAGTFRPIDRFNVSEEAVYENGTVDIGTVDVPNPDDQIELDDGNESSDGNESAGESDAGGNESGSLTGTAPSTSRPNDAGGVEGVPVGAPTPTLAAPARGS